MLNYKVTNQRIFNEKVLDIDLFDLRNSNDSSKDFEGTVNIEVLGIGWTPYEGSLNANTFHKEFGFKIIEE